MDEDYHGGFWDGRCFTNVVTTQIETIVALVLARVNTGLEAKQVRGSGGGGGRGGSDQAEGQSEGGEDGQEAHLG